MPKDDITLEEAKGLVVEVQKAFDEFKKTVPELIDKKTGESVDVLTKEKLDRIEKDLDEKQKKLDDLAIAAREKKVTLDGKEVDLDELNFKAAAFGHVCEEMGAKRRADSLNHEEVQEYKKHFLMWARRGSEYKEGLEPDERKALSVGSDPQGGYVVDPDTTGRIVKRLFDTSPIRAYASVQMISTNELQGIHDIDEVTTGWVGETAARPETDTADLAEWSIPVHEQYAEPRATQKLLDDAYIDMEAWLADKVADKMVRTENAAFVNGDGVKKPRGFMTYPARTAVNTYELGKIAQFETGAAGGFAADPDGFDKLIDMVYNLQDEYRNGAVWMANRFTYSAIRKLRDGDDNYIWQPSVQAGEPASILGYSTVVFEDMDSIADDAVPLAFGNLARAYQIVDRMGIRILRDPFTAKPYVKFYTTKRVGGDVIDFAAFNTLKMAD